LGGPLPLPAPTMLRHCPRGHHKCKSSVILTLNACISIIECRIVFDLWFISILLFGVH